MFLLLITSYKREKMEEIKEVAKAIIKENEKGVVRNLVEGKIMFEDEFNRPIPRPVAKNIPMMVEKKYGLDDGSVSYMEILINGEWRCVFWRNDGVSFSLDDINKMTEIHFLKDR